jgi:cell division protein FtsW (lipid II flippase)
MAAHDRKPIAFLPEAHTDFAFIVVPEWRRFAAVLVVVGFLAIWLWRCKRAR